MRVHVCVEKCNFTVCNFALRPLLVLIFALKPLLDLPGHRTIQHHQAHTCRMILKGGG